MDQTEKKDEAVKAVVEPLQQEKEEISLEAAKKMVKENQDIEQGDDASDTSFNPSDIEDEDLDLESGNEEEVSSSGESEDEFKPKEIRFGDTTHYKLVYKDIEEAKLKRKMELEAEESEGSDEEEEQDKKTDQTSFMEYRQALTDEEMENYQSDKDDDFDPVYCGETLSDHEYELDNSQEKEDRDTESEPETEMCEDVHKKTGEKLMMLKIHDLKIPPPTGCGTESPQTTVESAMEVA